MAQELRALEENESLHSAAEEEEASSNSEILIFEENIPE